MTALSRLRAAMARRVQGPYRSLGRLDARLADVQSRLDVIERDVADAGERSVAAAEEQVVVARETCALARQTHELLSGEMRALANQTHDLLGSDIRELAIDTSQLLNGEMRAALRAILMDESGNRRRLQGLRSEGEYAEAWTEPRPLVSVTVCTRDRAELLAARSLPSILAQTYAELEVVVVGDFADAATADAVRSIDDPRLSYRNLTQRLNFTNDPHRQWLVGSTMARNEAMRLARGRWVVSFDDDDSMRPDCIERLVTRAKADRLEAVYGRAMVRREDEREFAIGSFPPSLGDFTWASGMYHAGLRFLQRELFAADLGLPGDWFLAERMLRAGVRFGMVEEVLSDIYPSEMNGVRPPRLA